jgi:zinc/manganese transport system substrate-binding protein/zinc transport system substrate-binding protein
MDAEEYQAKPQDVSRLRNCAHDRARRSRLRLVGRAPAVAGRQFRDQARRDGYVDASYGIATLEVRGMSVGPGDGHAHGHGNPALLA